MSKSEYMIYKTSCYKFRAECEHVSSCSGQYKLYNVKLEMC